MAPFENPITGFKRVFTVPASSGCIDRPSGSACFTVPARPANSALSGHVGILKQSLSCSAEQPGRENCRRRLAGKGIYFGADCREFSTALRMALLLPVAPETASTSSD